MHLQNLYIGLEEAKLACTVLPASTEVPHIAAVRANGELDEMAKNVCYMHLTHTETKWSVQL